jgi:hypothetical protein
MSTHQSLARLGSVAALVGAAVLFASTLLHPMSRDPSNAPEANMRPTLSISGLISVNLQDLHYSARRWSHSRQHSSRVEPRLGHASA